MRGLIRSLVNIVLCLLPATRLFALKRLLWRSCGVALETGVKINSGARLFGNGKISIARDVWVGIDCLFIVPNASSVKIGSACDIAPGVMFECGSHQIGSMERRAGPGIMGDIEIGQGVWIGARALLLGGARIGAGSIVAAGAVVREGEYPENSLLAGVPAKVIRPLS